MSRDPFLGKHGYGAVDAASRIERVRSFTRAQCQAALTVPGLQKTVCAAIERRLRELRGRVVTIRPRG
ncbi:MAG: hypothetical protein IT529_06270 [Burkholderiales bacterium]|nr:hypothetical protein [Burkholderiales bacterium]